MPEEYFLNNPQPEDVKGIDTSKNDTESVPNTDDKSIFNKLSIANNKIIYYGNSNSKPSNK